MRPVSRFQRAPDNPGAVLRLTIDGEPLSARQGDTVAAALLAHSGVATRTTGVSGASRAPYCMMGVCFDCLIEIDGTPNRQACMVPARDGMVLRRMAGFRDLDGGAGDG